ncbi:hypothetical protein RF11_08373 [Thelohanellus kitauei]|uniref:Uncharacterized protein n=1 Tax=Thelohanellus kitauei TaxID=669202 RepID=A0A0C2IQB4_THEKT|nr:hypothetical protein RF11_08373 [Thelohanellus kitauei]
MSEDLVVSDIFKLEDISKEIEESLKRISFEISDSPSRIRHTISEFRGISEEILRCVSEIDLMQNFGVEDYKSAIKFVTTKDLSDPKNITIEDFDKYEKALDILESHSSEQIQKKYEEELQALQNTLKDNIRDAYYEKYEKLIDIISSSEYKIQLFINEINSLYPEVQNNPEMDTSTNKTDCGEGISIFNELAYLSYRLEQFRLCEDLSKIKLAISRLKTKQELNLYYRRFQENMRKYES